MSVTEAAKKIGISASKLYGLVAGRQIAHYRVGGKSSSQTLMSMLISTLAAWKWPPGRRPLPASL